MYEKKITRVEIERMDLMLNINDFLPEHRQKALQLIKHFELSGLLAAMNFDEGRLENASRCLDNQQDDLHELIQMKSLSKEHDHQKQQFEQLKALKDKRDQQEKQKQLHEFLRQQQISVSVVKKPKNN